MGDGPAWLEPRAPGDMVVKVKDGQLAHVGSDTAAVMIGAFASMDWVKLPEELGGVPARIVKRGRRVCPCCDRPMVHVHTEAGIGVIECTSASQFYCYEIPDSGLELEPL